MSTFEDAFGTAEGAFNVPDQGGGHSTPKDAPRTKPKFWDKFNNLADKVNETIHNVKSDIEIKTSNQVDLGVNKETIMIIVGVVGVLVFTLFSLNSKK